MRIGGTDIREEIGRAPVLHCVTLHSVGGLSVDLKRDRTGEVAFCVARSVKVSANMGLT